MDSGTPAPAQLDLYVSLFCGRTNAYVRRWEKYYRKMEMRGETVGDELATGLFDLDTETAFP